MMIPAYRNDYLDDVMTSVGAMLDYAVNSCGQDLALFYARFLASGIARELFEANPKYAGGLSGIELARLVAARTGDALPVGDCIIDIGSPEYWTGWTLAYVSFALDIDFALLNARGFTVGLLYERYSPLHEADLTKALQLAKDKLGLDAGEGAMLKRLRTVAGMTQRDLAARSGNTLRVIRAYEQGQRSLSNAGAASVRSLSRALGCRMEDLVG